MAASYSHLYQLPATGLRFYRVWPWGRPDMAPWLFEAILRGEPIKVFNHGRLQRFHLYRRYCEGILRVLAQPPQGLPAHAVQYWQSPAGGIDDFHQHHRTGAGS